MLLVAPRISCFPPGLNLITRFQVFGDGLPTTRFLGAVIAAGQPKRDKDQARASETNHLRRRNRNCARSNAVQRRSSNRNTSAGPFYPKGLQIIAARKIFRHREVGRSRGLRQLSSQNPFKASARKPVGICAAEQLAVLGANRQRQFE